VSHGSLVTTPRIRDALRGVLASADPADLEPLAGMPFLNGIPVRVDAVD
jgi:hypothetical protein